jgi:hypothetical protein
MDKRFCQMRNPKKILLLLVFACFLIQYSFGQTSKRKDNVLWGFNYGVSAFNKTQVEIGYGFVTDNILHKGKTSAIWDRYVLITGDLSTEFQLGKQFIIGPKISNKYSFELWDWEFNYWGFIVGADYIAYNDFRTLNNVFRPSIGLHYFLDTFELTYGYNLRLDNHAALPLNTHVIQLRCKPFVFIKTLSKAWGGK